MSAASNLIGRPLSALDTPALVVDIPVMMRNLARIADGCRAAGVQWRPHCKTHKSPAIAQLQLSHGACGITCAKLAEAEVMVAGGINDILLANQIVGPLKIARLMALCQTGATLAVAVDDAGNVTALAQAAAAAGVTLEVIIEVDTGTRRAGVAPGEPVLALARHIDVCPALRLRGVMTWEGHTTRIAEAVGDRLRWVVGYGDTTVHLHDRLYGIRDGVIVTEWAIPSGSRLR